MSSIDAQKQDYKQDLMAVSDLRASLSFIQYLVFSAIPHRLAHIRNLRISVSEFSPVKLGRHSVGRKMDSVESENVK